MSLRKLKYHEATLLRKVDFINWKTDSSLRENKILRRYHVQDREDYHTYNKICGMVTQLVTKLKALDQRDPVRVELTDTLLDRLFASGLIQHKRLASCAKLAASTLCRRRLRASSRRTSSRTSSVDRMISTTAPTWRVRNLATLSVLALLLASTSALTLGARKEDAAPAAPADAECEGGQCEVPNDWPAAEAAAGADDDDVEVVDLDDDVDDPLLEPVQAAASPA